MGTEVILFLLTRRGNKNKNMPSREGMLYRQYGWLCVCLLCRVYCSNAIVSLNCYTAKCGRRNAEVRMGVASQARLPWLSSPHFIMFSGYQFNKKVCQK